MSAIPIIGPLLAVVKEMGGKFLELKRVEADGRILVATAKAKAEATVLVTNAQSIADWERVQAENAASSWKDEFWTLLIALPITFVFWPTTREWVIEGFQALHSVPEWYMWAIAASISASFGIRTGIFEKIGFTSTKKGT